MDSLVDKRVVVMGLGRFGGGAGAALWALNEGASVLITDLCSHTQLQPMLKPFTGRDVSLRLGEHQLQDFSNADVVIVNPAVPRPWENPHLQAAHRSGATLTTEVGLLTERISRERTIGITGTAGKSTTAAMVHHALSSNGCRSHLGGNIGGSLLNDTRSIAADDWIVLELSSFMLYWLGDHDYPPTPPWSPGCAVLTNLTPNHLDWHGTLDHYRRSKDNISRWQRANETTLRGEQIMHQTPIDLLIPGDHNQRNAALAVETCHRAAGLSRDDAGNALRTFSGLPHRLQLIASHDGLRFYNDSKSTTPQATLLAIAAFDDPARVHLIAGGYDKGSDLSPIAAASERLGGLFTIGATGLDIARCATGRAVWCDTLDRAVDTALAGMSGDDVLLLSPGCASWDQFTNYEQRGDAFGTLVNRRIHHQPALRAQS